MLWRLLLLWYNAVCSLASCFLLDPLLCILSDPGDVSSMSSETSVKFYRTAQSLIPEDGTLHSCRCENLTRSELMNYNLQFLFCLFIVRPCESLRMCSVEQKDDRWVVKHNLSGWNCRVRTSYYAGNCVGGLRKIMKKIQHVWCSSRAVPLHQHGRKINLFLSSLYGMKH